MKHVTPEGKSLRNKQTLTVKRSVKVFSTLLGISIMSISLDAYSESIEEVCNKPIFKMWKEQQSERLWSPDKETLKAEQSGKVFTYNCFTFKDINIFFDTHEGRIENAHFYPILKTKDEKDTRVASGSDDDC
ncbi:MAG: hypothetical protein WBM38_14080 [Arenicellales bacterium]|jgi:hypothetical protein